MQACTSVYIVWIIGFVKKSNLYELIDDTMIETKVSKSPVSSRYLCHDIVLMHVHVYTCVLINQQCHACALLILMHASIQVIYINPFCGMFVIC